MELVLEDDRSDRDVLRERLRKIVLQDGVDLLLGPYGSGLTLAAGEVAAELRTVLWNHGGASDAIHECHPECSIGVLSPASRYLTTVLDMVETIAPPTRRIALFHADSGFAREIARGVERWTAARGRTLLLRTDAAGDPSRIGEAVTELASEAPDVMLGAGRFEDDLAFAEALWRVRPAIRAAACIGAGVDRFHDELGDRAEGFLAPVQWHPAVGFRPDFGPTPEAFVESYRRQTAEPLDYPAAQAYAAALIAQWCAERCGSYDPRQLRDTAARADLTTFYGRFRIDPRSGVQIGHEMLVTAWQGGRRRILWPEAATGSGETALPVVPWRRRGFRDRED